MNSNVLKDGIIYLATSKAFIYAYFCCGAFCKCNTWMHNGISPCQTFTVLWSSMWRTLYKWHYQLLLQLRKESTIVSFKRDKKQTPLSFSQALNCISVGSVLPWGYSSGTMGWVVGAACVFLRPCSFISAYLPAPWLCPLGAAVGLWPPAGVLWPPVVAPSAPSASRTSMASHSMRRLMLNVASFCASIWSPLIPWGVMSPSQTHRVTWASTSRGGPWIHHSLWPHCPLAPPCPLCHPPALP